MPICKVGINSKLYSKCCIQSRTQTIKKKILISKFLELTITLVSVIELFMIFPPAFSPIATPVTRRVTMPALLSSLAVSECGEI